MTLELIDEAVRAGAGLDAACQALGLSARTVARWRVDAGGEDGRAGSRHAPVHKLTEAERTRIVETANSPEFRDLSPKQIVPLLADRGVYIASESSFYRVLRKEGMMARRNKARPATRHRPRELVAKGPNQVWGVLALRRVLVRLCVVSRFLLRVPRAALGRLRRHEGAPGRAGSEYAVVGDGRVER